MTSIVSPSNPNSFRLQDAGGSWAPIVKACQRLNGTCEMQVDILAVADAFQLSTFQDFTAQGTLVNTVITPNGPIQLAPGPPVTLSQQIADISVQDQFLDNKGGPVRHWIDFFLDPAIVGFTPLTLSSIVVCVGRNFINQGYFPGQFQVTVTRFDESWRRVPLGDPFVISPPKTGIVTVDLTQGGTRQLVVDPGRGLTTTGPGFNGATGQLISVNPQIVNGVEFDYLTTIIGFSIGFEVHGHGNTAAFLCCNASGTAPAFDTTAFWRATANRVCGPYDPTVIGPSAADTNQNPGDQHLATGAIPGYGAIAVPGMGFLGRSKEVLNAGAPQRSTQSWDQPYHILQVFTFAKTGTVVLVGNFQDLPTEPVSLRLMVTTPAGTNITFNLAGSSTGPGGPWIPLGTVVDGQIFTAAGGLFQYYQLTATLTSDVKGFATPTLNVWQMVESTTIGTVGYLDDFDATSTIDPLTGQSNISELKLPIIRQGPRDFRDIATQINTQYTPANIEAHVYAVDLITGTRAFANSYHLENRNPSDIQEEMIFVSGLDRLMVQIPPASESFVFPNNAPSIACTGVTWFVLGPVVTAVIQFEGAAGRPFLGLNLSGFILTGVGNSGSGRLDGVSLFIVPFNTVHAYPNPGQVYPASATAVPPFGFNNDNTVSVVLINANQTFGYLPNVGDLFQIHSGIFTRPDLVYNGQDFAAAYKDLIANQAQVPQRMIGALPATTGRTTTTRITGTNGQAVNPTEGTQAGTTALDILSNVAMHCDGMVSWQRGRIAFTTLFGPKDALVAWDDRHIETIDLNIGMDRRCPSVIVKFGYNQSTNTFAFEVTYDDANAVFGVGRPNLFDIYQIPDGICQWCDVNEAQRIALQYLSAWSTGVRVWRIDTVFMYPWLNEGDAVSIRTEDYTDRVYDFSADGTVDNGSPISGRITALGVIVGKNLWGNQFLVAIRGIQDISFTAVSTGTRDGPTNALACPTVTASVQGIAVNDLGGFQAVCAFIPPTTPYFKGIVMQIETDSNPPAYSHLSPTSPIYIPLAAATAYTLTPYCVTTGDVYTAGTPIVIPKQTRTVVLPPGTLGNNGVTADPVVTRPTQPVSARNGATVTFAAAPQNIPTVVPRKGVTHEIRSLWGTDPQTIAQVGNTSAFSTSSQEVDETAAIAVTTAGFVARCRLSQPGSTTTPRSVSFPNTQIPQSSTGAGLSLGANLPAYNDQYTATATVSFVVAFFGTSSGSAQMTVYLDVSIDGGSTWNQVANASAAVSGIAASGTYTAPVNLAFGETGLPASTTMVRLRTSAAAGVAVAITNAYVVGGTASWATNSASVQYASTTPNPTDSVTFDVTTTT